MKTVKEVSRITGVSVRTLHHYDAIGLLRPTKSQMPVTGCMTIQPCSGYRPFFYSGNWNSR